MSNTFRHADGDWIDALRLARECGLRATTADVLVSRGVRSVEDARAILEPGDDAKRMHDPFLLGDMRAAVERIRFAIEDGQQIAVHGDYDADGMCATVLLVEALESLGANVVAFLPTRTIHGYGLSLDVVEQFAADGIRLIITVDCGITAVQQIQQAIDHGMDVIVCDHHQPGEELPPAIICSTRPSNYPFPDLCATAVAGKLAQALGADLGSAAHELEAIATIADCVPLVGENRAIVRRGLAALRATRRPGLRALMSASDLHARSVDEESVAFKLAPRLNATGRIADPERAYELLRAASDEYARTAAASLHQINDSRRRIEQEILAEAEAQIAAWTPEQRARKLWVVAGHNWHEGVVGIVAARLVGTYHRPVLVIGTSGALARGSGRSIDGFDLHAAVRSADDLLVRWGGHHSAVGVTVDPTQLEALAERLAAYADPLLAESDLVASCTVDAVLHPNELDLGLVEELALLAPCGQDNPRPLVMVPDAIVVDASIVGADQRHLRGRVRVGEVTAPFIAFGAAAHAQICTPGAVVSLAAHLSINRFRGSETLQLEVVQLAPVLQSGTPVGVECVQECNFSCEDRIELVSVLERATNPAPQATISGHADLPSVSEFVDHPGGMDVRGGGVDVSHLVRQAVARGTSIVVLCADVARRRSSLLGSTSALRALGCTHVMYASGRCNTVKLEQRLIRCSDAGEQFVMLVDEDAPLNMVLSAAAQAGASTLVVADPPMHAGTVQTATGSGLRPVMVWGAAETRFVLAAATAVAHVRDTLGPAWKQLRSGIDDSTQLEHVLFGGRNAPILHHPDAVSHALHVLQQKSLVQVDAAGGRVDIVHAHA